MSQYMTEHKEIVWLAIVAIFTFVMLFLVKNIFKFFIKKAEKKGGKGIELLNTLRRIFKMFFGILGIGLASYAFFQKELHTVINENLLRAIWIMVVMLATVITVAIIQSYFTRKIAATSRRDKQDPTTYKFLSYLVTFAIYFLGILLAAVAIPALRTLAQSMLAGAGVIAVIAGVAAQEGISNLIGGIFIVFFKPFRIGDVIKVGDQIVGTVEDLNLRHTVINNFQNKRVVIPNATMNKENIINYYLGEYKTCEWVEVGISYDSDIDKAMAIMVEESQNHTSFYDNRSKGQKDKDLPAVDVKVIGLGDSSVNIRAWVWAATYQTAFNMRNDLYKSIKQRFDAEGIEIPFPHRTLIHKNLTRIPLKPMHNTITQLQEQS